MTTHAQCTKHCYCRSKTVATGVMTGTATKRVRYCCWCGKEKS